MQWTCSACCCKRCSRYHLHHNLCIFYAWFPLHTSINSHGALRHGAFRKAAQQRQQHTNKPDFRKHSLVPSSEKMHAEIPREMKLMRRTEKAQEAVHWHWSERQACGCQVWAVPRFKCQQQHSRLHLCHPCVSSWCYKLQLETYFSSQLSSPSPPKNCVFGY